MKRSFTAPQLRLVAARQDWKCSACSCVLPAAFEVDHTIALADNGADELSNATAMCPNCHAEKTLVERVARAEAATARARENDYDERTDIVVSPGAEGKRGTVRCALCFQTRRELRAHTFCRAIEAKYTLGHQSLAEKSLEQFRFIPRGGAK